MRYLLSKSLQDELHGRVTYLYNVFHVYFSSVELGDFIQLVPIGTLDLSVLFIVGHNNNVFHYIRENCNLIKEKTIVLITCIDTRRCTNLPSGKTIYATNPLSDGFTTLYNGMEFGFSFKISESELLFHKDRNTDYQKRISESFYLIKS